MKGERISILYKEERVSLVSREEGVSLSLSLSFLHREKRVSLFYIERRETPSRSRGERLLVDREKRECLSSIYREESGSSI